MLVLLFAALAVSTFHEARRTGSAEHAGWAFAHASFALALLSTLHLNILRRRLPAGIEPPYNTTLDGEPATFIPRWRYYPRLVYPAFFAFGSSLALGTIIILRSPGENADALLIGLIAVWLLTLPLWVAMGRWAAGGIWITPTRVVHHGGSAWFSVSWDDITAVDSVHRGLAITAKRAEWRHLTPTFKSRGVIPWRRKSAPFLVMDLQFLAIRGSTLLRLLDGYLSGPQERRHAGHADCVALIERHECDAQVRDAGRPQPL